MLVIMVSTMLIVKKEKDMLENSMKPVAIKISLVSSLLDSGTIVEKAQQQPM